MTGSDRPNVGQEPGSSDSKALGDQSQALSLASKGGVSTVAPAPTLTPNLPPGTAPVVPSKTVVLSTPKVPNLGDVDKGGSAPDGSTSVDGNKSSSKQGTEDDSPEALNTEQPFTFDGTCKSSGSEKL
jgi:hypothetical protein